MPGLPSGVHLMANAFGYLQNMGLGGYRVENPGVDGWDGGRVTPLLTGVWVMVYARDAGGWVEGHLMVDLEPLTVGRAGIPELGQAGEGLIDAQPSHLLLHQAMVAFHPLVAATGPPAHGREPDVDLAIFAGQGSATIGPPLYMHRASAPGPTTPRKHHKGENPHETFPVLGLSVRVLDTTVKGSAFSGRELQPTDSRYQPHAGVPGSFAFRARHRFAGAGEVQASAERLRDQGHDAPDAWQASASVTAWGEAGGWCLLDYGVDLPDAEDPSHGLLVELAARDPSRRDILWTRLEVGQREERSGGVSSPWVFASLGFERVIGSFPDARVGIGLFGEATLVHVPDSLVDRYGAVNAVTLDLGVHLLGMWQWMP